MPIERASSYSPLVDISAIDRDILEFDAHKRNRREIAESTHYNPRSRHPAYMAAASTMKAAA
jgi:hypothetical protein